MGMYSRAHLEQRGDREETGQLVLGKARAKPRTIGTIGRHEQEPLARLRVGDLRRHERPQIGIRGMQRLSSRLARREFVIVRLVARVVEEPIVPARARLPRVGRDRAPVRDGAAVVVRAVAGDRGRRLPAGASTTSEQLNLSNARHIACN